MDREYTGGSTGNRAGIIIHIQDRFGGKIFQIISFTLTYSVIVIFVANLDLAWFFLSKVKQGVNDTCRDLSQDTSDYSSCNNFWWSYQIRIYKDKENESDLAMFVLLEELHPSPYCTSWGPLRVVNSIWFGYHSHSLTMCTTALLAGDWQAMCLFVTAMFQLQCSLQMTQAKGG